MARSDELKHKQIIKTGLPYWPDDYPTSGEPRFVSGSNILTSYRGYSERRPGYTSYIDTSTQGNPTINRIFLWRKWNGSYIIMLSGVLGADSYVYSHRIGVDAAPQLRYADIGNTAPFDFVVANNKVFFSNGNAMWYWDGVLGTHAWGIGTSPMFRAITSATNATPIAVATSSAHNMATGDKVFIYGVTGNTAANGYWTITSTGASSFTLDTSVGNGAYVSGGFVTLTSWSVAGTGITSTVGWKYVYTFGSSVSKHQSNPSHPTISTGVVTNDTVTVKGYKSTDSQVDLIHVYRTTDGGGGIYFELPNSPISITAGAGTWTIADTATDLQLQSTKAPFSTIPDDKTRGEMVGMNDPPESKGSTGVRGKQPTWFANRIWFFLRNEVHYSAWEEMVDPGVEEESFPDENVFFTENEVTGLASVEDYLLIFTASSIWRVEGDSLDTFTFTRIFRNMGLRNHAALATFGKACAWLDSSDLIRITNGIVQEEISIPIRSNLEGITHANCNLAFHSDGKRHWLLVADGTVERNKLFVYDLDTDQWMPPWDILNITALASGETSAGVIDFFYGIGIYANRITPTVYTDNIAGAATTYTANGVTGLTSLYEKDTAGHIGRLEYISIERNAVAITDVLYETDDSPLTATFISIVSNLGDAFAQRRTTGTNIVEEWYYGLGTCDAARRIAFKFTWAAASTNFNLFTIDVAYKEMEK